MSGKSQKKEKHLKSRHIFGGFVLAGLLFVAFYICVVVTGANIPIINPAAVQTTLREWTTGYFTTVASNGAVIPVLNFNPTIIVYLRFQGSLTAQKNVTMSGEGFATAPAIINSVFECDIIIPQTEKFPISNTSSGEPATAYVKLKNNGDSRLTGSSVNIYFPSQGSFTPIISILYDNATVLLAQNMGSFSVQPQSEQLTENFNRVNLGLALALIYFGFVEATKTIYDYLREKP
jgi:hypothetical protein